MPPDTLNLILSQLLEGQAAIEKRLSTIETTLAEKRGERRVALWAVGTASGAAGAMFPSLLKFLHG